MMRSAKNMENIKRGLAAATAAVVLGLPLLIHDAYFLSVLVFIGIYSIVTVSLCLLMGYAGQISLGHAAFYGLGAYGSGILTVRFGLNPWLGMAAAAAFTGLIALVIGIPTLRLKEHFLALATLGFGIIIYIVFMQEALWTGGPSGLTGIPYLTAGSLVFNTDLSYYYLVWGMVLATVLICGNVVNSRIGRALKAIHGSELAAQSMGVDTPRIKLQIFVFSAMFASIAGSLYAHYVTMINPSPFGFKMSVEFVLMAVVGGIASVWGPLFGVAAVTILTEMLREYIPLLIPGAGGEVEIVAFGLILTVIMIFLPEGLFRGLADRWEMRYKRKRRKGIETGSEQDAPWGEAVR